MALASAVGLFLVYVAFWDVFAGSHVSRGLPGSSPTPPAISPLPTHRRRQQIGAVAVGLGAGAAVALGTGILWAVPLTAFTAGRSVLWIDRRRRRARRDLADVTAIAFMRRVGAELAVGRGLSEAIDVLEVSGPAEHFLVAETRRRLAAGIPLSAALAGALASLGDGALHHGSASAMVVATLGLSSHSNHEIAVGSRRLADALERRRRSDRAARAALTEARMVAVAVPILGAFLSLVVMLTSRGAMVFAVSPSGCMIELALGLLALSGAALTLRMTRS